MTREEKIEILEKEKANMLSHSRNRQAIALDSAINALEENEWLKEQLKQVKTELVRRDAVLELINDVKIEGGFTRYHHYKFLFEQVDTMQTVFNVRK